MKSSFKGDWSAMIDETDINKIRVLYQFPPDIGIFSNLQLVFDLLFREDNPPVLNVLTPNGRLPINEIICLEHISYVNTFETLIDTIISIFLDDSSIVFGFRICEDIKTYVNNSITWNKGHYIDIYNQYNEQSVNKICDQFAKIVNFNKTMEED